MTLMITVNFWFLVSVCLLAALVGMFLGAYVSRGGRYRF